MPLGPILGQVHAPTSAVTYLHNIFFISVTLVIIYETLHKYIATLTGKREKKRFLIMEKYQKKKKNN